MTGLSPLVHDLIVFCAGALASGINAVAFGGTLISFPTLVWLGVPPIVANATNSASIWPGSLGSIWGYRRELRQNTEPRMLWLVVPSIVGTLTGARLLRVTPAAVFDEIVPLLILFATILFAVQDRFQGWLKYSPEDHGKKGLVLSMVFQFFVAVYGGYFGAGMGILMLAALAVLGHEDIHHMNGLKNLLSLFINGVASIYFFQSGMVLVRETVIMASGAILGGLLSAGFARRMGRQFVRRAVVATGVVMTLVLFWRL